MAIKRKHCMIEEKEYSLWHLLPHDVLWMIIERLDLIACHCVSAVCGNWSSVCKSYRTLKSFPMPKDTFPWLMMRKNKFSGMEIQLYRPSTNKTYKMDFPEIYGTHCLYSKDGWLLLHELEQRKSYESVKLCLINLFTRDKMELPELKANKQIFRTKGTFSTHSNCPDCVIIIKGEFHHRLVTLYAWKKGSYTWKKTQVYDNMFADNMSNIWVRDDQLYIFTDRKCFTFDRDLNFKVQNMFQNILNLKNMIFFRKNDEISFMVREECTKARSLLLNNMKNSSCCQIKPSTKELYHKVVFENESFALFLGTVYQYDRSTRKWVEFNFNNLISSSEEDIGILEREQQIKAKKQLLIEKLQHGGKISTEDGTFVVCGPKSGISNWIHVG